MKLRIGFPLCAEIISDLKLALEEVEKIKRRGGKVIDIELSDDGEGNPVARIVLDAPHHKE
jgi:hypothetical protein